MGGGLSESGLNSFECLHKDQNMESLSPPPRFLLTPAPVSACSKTHLKKPGLSAQSTKESYSSKSKDIELKCYAGESEKSPRRIELILTKVQDVLTRNTGAHYLLPTEDAINKLAQLAVQLVVNTSS